MIGDTTHHDNIQYDDPTRYSRLPHYLAGRLLLRSGQIGPARQYESGQGWVRRPEWPDWLDPVPVPVEVGWGSVNWV